MCYGAMQGFVWVLVVPGSLTDQDAVQSLSDIVELLQLMYGPCMRWVAGGISGSNTVRMHDCLYHVSYAASVAMAHCCCKNCFLRSQLKCIKVIIACTSVIIACTSHVSG